MGFRLRKKSPQNSKMGIRNTLKNIAIYSIPALLTIGYLKCCGEACKNTLGLVNLALRKEIGQEVDMEKAKSLEMRATLYSMAGLGFSVPLGFSLAGIFLYSTKRKEEIWD